MSGYAIPSKENKASFIFEPDTIDQLYDSVFYGMTFDPKEGKVTIEVIKEDEPIVIPDSLNFQDGDYAHWFSSSKEINFTWKETKKTHLFMEVV